MYAKDSSYSYTKTLPSTTAGMLAPGAPIAIRLESFPLNAMLKPNLS